MRSGSATISRTVIRGLSDAYGSWKTIWMSRRTGRICLRLNFVMSVPLKMMLAARRLDELDDRSAERRLPAAGLADDAERLSAQDRKVDPVHGAHLADGVLEDTGLDREVLDETLDPEDLVRIAARRTPAAGLGALAARSRRSSSRARRDARRPATSSSAKWHAEMCVSPLPNCRSSGISVRQRARPCDWTQRGWKAQPGGGVTRLGGWPGIGSSHSCSPSSRARLFMSPTVYGWRGDR